MRSTIRHTGLDVHQDTITIAQAIGDAEPQLVGTIPNSRIALHRELKQPGPSELLCCAYEAGPNGYELYRMLRSAGIDCVGAAPSPIPEEAGDRIKTDRRVG